MSRVIKVPFFRPSISEEAIDEVTDSIRRGWLTSGPKVARFEQQFAGAVGARHAVAVSSCTAALHLALVSLRVERGDVVVVPTMSFPATAEVVRYVEAEPAFVDCDETLNISITALSETLTALSEGRSVPGAPARPRPAKVLIPMHYGGFSVAMGEVCQLASRHGASVVEDAAHAFPAHYRDGSSGDWRACGTLGKLGCFSFYANKCITTGEGGMVTTGDDKLAVRIRRMRLHGMDSDAWDRERERYGPGGAYEVVDMGFKYNMTDLAASLGIHQLRRAQELRAARERIAGRYLDAFADLDAVKLPPVDHERRRHSWHLFPIRLRLDLLAIDRDEFARRLRARGVATSVHWKPIHLHDYYRRAYGLREGMFPMAEGEWSRVLSLPVFPSMTDQELELVIKVVRCEILRASLARVGRRRWRV